MYDMNIPTYINTHTCMHLYTHMHEFVHTYIHTYIKEIAITNISFNVVIALVRLAKLFGRVTEKTLKCFIIILCKILCLD